MNTKSPKASKATLLYDGSVDSVVINVEIDKERKLPVTAADCLIAFENCGINILDDLETATIFSEATAKPGVTEPDSDGFRLDCCNAIVAKNTKGMLAFSTTPITCKPFISEVANTNLYGTDTLESLFESLSQISDEPYQFNVFQVSDNLKALASVLVKTQGDQVRSEILKKAGKKGRKELDIEKELSFDVEFSKLMEKKEQPPLVMMDNYQVNLIRKLHKTLEGIRSQFKDPNDSKQIRVAECDGGIINVDFSQGTIWIEDPEREVIKKTVIMHPGYLKTLFR